nr:hypothetical protein CFP56_34937 [Quercus suber]
MTPALLQEAAQNSTDQPAEIDRVPASSKLSLTHSSGIGNVPPCLVARVVANFARLTGRNYCTANTRRLNRTTHTFCTVNSNMVAFKNLLLGATVLLGGVAAAPSQSKNLNMLQKRALFETMDANNICENEYVLPATISDNNGAATVVDLTGCTAVFFYLEDEDSGTPTLRYAYHIQCGIEATDGQTAAQMSPGVDTAVIAATSSDTYETTKAAIMAGRPTITNFIFQIYSKENIPTGQGVTFTATSGTTNIVQGLKDIVCGEPGPSRL